MMNEEDLARAANRLAAGRILAMEKWPYLEHSLKAMVAVPREGLKTFAVDQRWRMYYDPQVCLEWTVSEIAATWLHECGHVFRDHSKRFAQFSEKENFEEWNQSADGAINSDLRAEGIILPNPERRFYAEANPLYPDWKPGMTTEEMYRIAVGHKNGNKQDDQKGSGPPEESDSAESEKGEPSQDSSDSSDKTEDSDSSETTDSAKKNEKTDKDSEKTDKDSSSKSKKSENDDKDEDSGEENSPGQGDKEKDDTLDSEDEKNEEESSSGVTSDDENGDDGETDESEGTNRGSEDKEGDNDEEESGEGEAEAKAKGHGSPHSDCGSGATGGKRDYEETNDDDGSLDEFSASVVQERTANAILDASNRGTVPAGLVREAKEVLDPQVDWHREILAWVRRAMAVIAGKKDYSYSRPSRRSSMTSFYLPSMRSPRPPIIRVVLDTSGSMTIDDLTTALSEIAALVKKIRSGGASQPLQVINCDADAYTVDAIKDIDDFIIKGGGGTDMRKGIKIAAQAKPKPDVILTITDGGTPWPKEPYKDAPGAKYVVLLVEQSSGNGRSYKVTQPPEWMHVINVKRNTGRR